MRTLFPSLTLLLMLTSAPLPAANWLTVAGDRLRSVEIDRDSILDAEAGSRVAWGRVVLSPEQAAKSGYRTVRTLNRYDCNRSAFQVVKRVYEDTDGNTLREDEPARQVSSPVRPGTADERFFREVCPAAREVVAKPSASQLNTRALLALAKQAERRAAAANRTASPQNTDGLRLIDTAAVLSPPAASGAGTAAPRRSAPAVRPGAKPGATTPAPRPHAERPWSYSGSTGPQAWADLSAANALCATGTRQSPIDLRDGIKVDQDPLGFDYKLSYFKIVDNGRTLHVGYGRGSWLNVMGRHYELEYVDFHSPSESQVAGRNTEMSMQLFHRDAEGHVAILEVLLEEGPGNPQLQIVLNNLPLEAQQEYTAQTPLQLIDALPTQRGYFAYMGSLSAPPCTENVLRLVLKTPATLSREQIDIFRRIHDQNVRPLQPSAGRILRESR